MDGINLQALPEAVFFDWDGTLVNSLAFLTKAHNYAKDNMGLPLFAGEHEFQPYLGMPRDLLYADIYGSRGEEAKKYFEEYVHEFHTKGVQPLEGVEDILRFFKEQGIPCGVVSNKRAIFLNEEIKVFGWTSYFQSVVGAGDAKEDKPSAAPLFLAMERAGLSMSLEKVWYIGDTEFDIACAKNAGARSIIIRPPYEQEKDFSNLENEPDLVVGSAHDFMLFLKEIRSF